MELVNSCVFQTPGFGLSLVWGTELVQCVATDCLHYDVYLRHQPPGLYLYMFLISPTCATVLLVLTSFIIS